MSKKSEQEKSIINIDIRYTVINHEARVSLNLDFSEYSVADIIYNICKKPGNEWVGWCSVSKAKLSNFIGITPRQVFNIIKKLEKKGILKRSKQGFLKTTNLWYETVIIVSV